MGYRVYHVGQHLIFYRQKSTGIEIIRILHDRMDVETHLRMGLGNAAHFDTGRNEF
jgi:toxin ParE1/3/4